MECNIILYFLSYKFLISLGISHGADMIFISYHSNSHQDMTDTESDDYKVMKRIVKMWTTFAKTGYV